MTDPIVMAALVTAVPASLGTLVAVVKTWREVKSPNGTRTGHAIYAQSELLAAHTALDEVRFQELNEKMDRVLAEQESVAGDLEERHGDE